MSIGLDQSFDARFLRFLASTSMFGLAEWIEAEGVSIYIRLGTRLVPGTLTRIRTIEVANITIREDLRGKGRYSTLLALIDAVAGPRMVYIENVHNKAQHPIYLRRGFQRVVIGVDPLESASFYKLPKG